MDELDSKSVSANVRRAPTQLRHQDADQEQESATYVRSCHCIQTPTGLLPLLQRTLMD
jgi:predicted SprT family Zn-dependent metalloprotease